MLDTPGTRWLALAVVAVGAALLGSLASSQYQGIECGPNCLWRLDVVSGEVCRLQFSGAEIDRASCRRDDWVQQHQRPQSVIE